MLKELKTLVYLVIIFVFFFFTIKYYFSDEYKKNSYRKINHLNDDLISYGNQLKILDSNTKKIIQYFDNDKSKKKKKYHFWDLLKKDG